MELKKYSTSKLSKGKYNVVVDKIYFDEPKPEYNRPLNSLTMKLSVIDGLAEGASIYKRFNIFEDNKENRTKQISDFVEAVEAFTRKPIPPNMTVEGYNYDQLTGLQAQIQVEEYKNNPFVKYFFELPSSFLNKSPSFSSVGTAPMELSRQKINNSIQDDEVPF